MKAVADANQPLPEAHPSFDIWNSEFDFF